MSEWEMDEVYEALTWRWVDESVETVWRPKLVNATKTERKWIKEHIRWLYSLQPKDLVEFPL